jgi:hypothetical protein
MKNISILFYLTCLFASYCNSSITETKSEFILPNGAITSIIEDAFDETKYKIKKMQRQLHRYLLYRWKRTV